MTTERTIAGSNFVFFGGSTGIGRASAIELGRRGANVLIVGRGRQAGEATTSAVRAAGALSADYLEGDLSTVAGISAVAESVRDWRPELHGMMHTAMAAFRGRQQTVDGFEFAFALQYFARAALNRLLVDRLAASGDGRIVHIAGNAPGFFMPDLEDLQYDRRKWTFFKSILGTHLLGFLHIQQAAKLWGSLPVTIAATCVGATRTKAMLDPAMPMFMRVIGRFGTSPDVSAVNAVRFLTVQSSKNVNGCVFRSAKRYDADRLSLNSSDAADLWQVTTTLAAERGASLS